MAKTVNYPIDGEKLLQLLEDHGVDAREASEVIGYGPGYINQSARKGCIEAPAIKLITAFYNIDYAEYKPEEPKPEEPEENTANDIYRAVLDATRAADDIMLHKMGLIMEPQQLQKGFYAALNGFWLRYREDIINAMAEAIRRAGR